MHIGGCVSHVWDLLACKPAHLFVHQLIFPWQNLTEDVGQDNHPAGENGRRPLLSPTTRVVPIVYAPEWKAREIIRLICCTYERSSPSMFAFCAISLLLKSHATQEKEETLSWRWPISKEKSPGQVNTLFESLKSEDNSCCRLKKLCRWSIFPILKGVTARVWNWVCSFKNHRCACDQTSPVIHSMFRKHETSQIREEETFSSKRCLEWFFEYAGGFLFYLHILIDCPRVKFIHS